MLVREVLPVPEYYYAHSMRGMIRACTYHTVFAFVLEGYFEENCISPSFLSLRDPQHPQELRATRRAQARYIGLAKKMSSVTESSALFCVAMAL